MRTNAISTDILKLGRLVGVAGVLLAGSEAMAGFGVFEGAAATPAALTPTRDAFRTAVGGGSTAGSNGDFGGVRREINWDGVGDAFSDPNALPGNFFNATSPRGVVFSTPGTGFLVSANAGQATSPLFGFPGDLQTFSSQKLFATVNSNVMDISFFVPGTTTPATTSAFAAIFVDAEDNSSSTFTNVEFFDVNGVSIFSRNALAAGNQGLSFVGAVADAGEQVARVRITMPANFLVSNGVRNNELVDFVVMDDFLYGTPVAIPEPAALAMVGGVLGMGLRRRR